MWKSIQKILRITGRKKKERKEKGNEWRERGKRGKRLNIPNLYIKGRAPYFL